MLLCQTVPSTLAGIWGGAFFQRKSGVSYMGSSTCGPWTIVFGQILAISVLRIVSNFWPVLTLGAQVTDRIGTGFSLCKPCPCGHGFRSMGLGFWKEIHRFRLKSLAHLFGMRSHRLWPEGRDCWREKPVTGRERKIPDRRSNVSELNSRCF